ncbi:unnamed protein product [Closterium sp. NIES-53]
MTLAALGFAPSSADPSLFLRTDTSLPPFYVLVYIEDLVFATAETEALALVKLELQKRHTCTDLGDLGLKITQERARRTITLTQSHMVHQFLQRFGFRYSSPQSTPLPTGHSLAAPPSDDSYPCTLRCARETPVSTGRPLRGCWITWRSIRSSYVLISNCEAEIYSGAMATQELHWLTYLLTDLGERPRSSPVLTKHIALRYFLARELQQRGQLRLAYMAIQANTVDIFTKALQTGDHQRFCIVLGLVPTSPHLLTA